MRDVLPPGVEVFRGVPGPHGQELRENGATFAVDLLEGQKTGWCRAAVLQECVTFTKDLRGARALLFTRRPARGAEDRVVRLNVVGSIVKEKYTFTLIVFVM